MIPPSILHLSRTDLAAIHEITPSYPPSDEPNNTRRPAFLFDSEQAIVSHDCICVPFIASGTYRGDGEYHVYTLRASKDSRLKESRN